MKTCIQVCLMLFIAAAGFAQEPAIVDEKVHLVVMQVNTGDSSQQASVAGQVANILNALPKARVEVVCHGPGLDMLTKSKSKVSAEVASLSARGVVFAACQNTMRRRKVTREDLLPQHVVVPSGMAELIVRQDDGWRYVKGGH